MTYIIMMIIDGYFAQGSLGKVNPFLHIYSTLILICPSHAGLRGCPSIYCMIFAIFGMEIAPYFEGLVWRWVYSQAIKLQENIFRYINGALIWRFSGCGVSLKFETTEENPLWKIWELAIYAPCMGISWRPQ